jgi:predicted XRE-type DNA-binding protein
MSEDPRFTESSGNVFADLGMDDADEMLAKAQLAYEIAKIIERNEWNQAEAAHILEIDQPKVSMLLRGRLSGFSTERLFRFLNALGQNVEIVVFPKPASQDRAGIAVVSRDRVAS